MDVHFSLILMDGKAYIESKKTSCGESHAAIMKKYGNKMCPLTQLLNTHCAIVELELRNECPAHQTGQYRKWLYGA